MISNNNLRLYVIPILMGMVWVLSFAISYFGDLSISKEWSYALKLSSAFNIVLFFDLILMIWDIKLSLKDYFLEKYRFFNLQCVTVPFFILAAPFGFIAFNGGWWLIAYIGILFGAKTSMHYSVIAVDKYKIPIGYGPLEEI
ncbi:MAG: hypothetical protein K2N35_12465 [Muribaculaceae bacterium]|nr:hypothetical protein [Muribaculaceae bacterium]